MAKSTDIPPLEPSSEWYEDWSFGVDTLVQVEARVAGAAADRAVNTFLEPLTRDTDADHANGSRFYYWGGFTVESAPLTNKGGWRLVLASARSEEHTSELQSR